jgi:hypothetical protein
MSAEDKKPAIDKKRPLLILDAEDQKPKILPERKVHTDFKIVVIEDEDDLLRPVPGISMDKKPAIVSPPHPAPSSQNAPRIPLQEIFPNNPGSIISVAVDRTPTSIKDESRVKEPKTKRNRSDPLSYSAPAEVATPRDDVAVDRFIPDPDASMVFDDVLEEVCIFFLNIVLVRNKLLCRISPKRPLIFLPLLFVH